MYLGLYCFDFSLTFQQQIKFFHGKKLSLPAVLFVLLHMCTFCALLCLNVLGWAIPCEVSNTPFPPKTMLIP